jgi:NAD(P)H-nitrite reductase large subunit
VDSGVRRFVIIGNGAAGTTAAEALRRHDTACSVTLLTDEPYALYNRVALPRMLKGEVPPERVFLRRPADHAAAGIDFLPGTRVVAVDARGRSVHLEGGRELPYDALLVATGGRPRPLPAPGGDAPNCLPFQFYDDTVALSEAISRARRAVAVGGSFISYELAEGFRARGLEVVWLIRGPRWLRRILDEEGGALVDRIAAAHGVEVIHGEEVAKVTVRDGLATGIVTTAGRSIDCDLVGSGLGLRLNTDVVRGTAVEVRTGIVTDRCLQTAEPGIFAAGDVAEYEDEITGSHHVMGTWDNALAHGRIAAANMLGAASPYVDVPTYQSGLFDTIISVLGVTPETLPDPESVVRCDMERRTYRKLFFEGGRLVGAVMIGSIRGKKRLMDLIRQGAAFPSGPEREALLQG